MVREVNLARLESRRAGYCFEIQQFMDIYQADAGDYRKAVQSIHRSTASSSHLALPVMVQKGARQ